jgi:hypothetical protein
VIEAGGAVDPRQLSSTKKVAFALIVIVVPLAVLAVAGELVLRWSEPPLPETTGTVVRRTGESEKQYELLPTPQGSSRAPRFRSTASAAATGNIRSSNPPGL